MSLLCLFLSRRGCSKLLTIDNKCRGPVLSLQPFPARSQEQHGRGAPFVAFKQMQFISARNENLGPMARLVRTPHPGIVLNDHYDGDGEIVFEHACKLTRQ